MKAYVLICFLYITYAFSEKLIHKKSTSLNFTNSSLNSISKERILALILGKSATDNNCQVKLKEYCDNLRNMDFVLGDLHSSLEKTCEGTKIKEECNDLKNIIKETCNTHQILLESALEVPFVLDGDCLLEDDCMFLEEVCSLEFIEKCSKLRERCRNKRRNTINKEILLRALSGNLENKKACEKVINEKCFLLIEESDELMSFCLTKSDKCGELVNIMKNECKKLVRDIESLFYYFDRYKTQCILLLEKCYFYKNCNNIQNKCEKLKKKCREVEYTLPSLAFNPLEKTPTFIEKLGKEKLFGNEIGKPETKDTIDLLILMTNNDITKCEDRLEECYNFCNSLPQLKDLYNIIKKNKKEEMCTSLRNKLNFKCKAFKSELFSVSLSNTKNNEEAKLLGWFEQFPELDEKLCTNLKSKCFYLQEPCASTTKLNNACSNVESACLKVQLLREEYYLFESMLRGKLHNLTIHNFLKICVNELFNLCRKGAGIREPISANLCLQPWTTCLALENDIERQNQEFKKDLNQKKDFPNKEECKKFEEKCKTLGQDSKMNELSCFTLKERCSYLTNIRDLEEVLLEEKIEALTYDLCIKKMTEKCNNRFKRNEARFIHLCIQLDVTCRIIIENIQFKCNALEKNINTEVLKHAKNEDINIKGQTCDFWEPYCDRLMLSCEKFMQSNEKDKKCKELKVSCMSYRIAKNQETEVIYELRGNLTENKCKSTLNEYCLHWSKTKNDTFKNLCNNIDIKNDTFKDKLCKKLIEQVKERCTKLFKKLNIMATEIEENVQIVKKLNKVAKEMLENTTLILISNRQRIDKNTNSAALVLSYNVNTNIERNFRTDTTQNNQLRYLQLRETELDVIEREIEVFDAAIEALKIYKKVNADCGKLSLECEFKEDCFEYKDICKKIEKACNKLEPLEIKPKTKIVTQTITETITIIKTDSDVESKTVIKGEQCISVRTSDTWVMHTSTHTYTFIQTSIVTSTTTLTSTKQCKSIECITKDKEIEDAKPSKGSRLGKWIVIKELILAISVLAII
ncbi:hypothetical protein PMAC_000251 [Pneumocystis sp. 'macacae']|nr:hypothetical protein PMAC_000251 [Pneumocystis sp. 'macacae']